MQKDHWTGYFIVRNTLFVYNTEALKKIANKSHEKTTSGPYVIKKEHYFQVYRNCEMYMKTSYIDMQFSQY